MKNKITRAVDYLLVPVYGIGLIINLSTPREAGFRARWKARRPRVVELWDRGGRRR